MAAIVLDRFYALTGEKLYRSWAERTLEAFACLAPQYGLFAATYGLAALLHARHPLQVVITGSAGDRRAAALESAAQAVFRFGKSVLRITPEQLASDTLPQALAETLPHLHTETPQALICVEMSCQRPISEPSELTELLGKLATDRPPT